MSDVTRRCLFCDHAIEFGAGRADSRRKFCFSCLPPHSSNSQAAYVARYNFLRSACGIGNGPVAATSQAIPSGHPARPPKPRRQAPSLVATCAGCGETFTGKAAYCSPSCKRRHLRSRASATSLTPPPVPRVVVVEPSRHRVVGRERTYRNVRELVPNLSVVGDCHYCSGPLRPWWTLYPGLKSSRRCYECYLSSVRERYRSRASGVSGPKTGRTKATTYGYRGAVVQCVICSAEFTRTQTNRSYCSAQCKAVGIRDRDRRQNYRRRGAPVGQRYSLMDVFNKSNGHCHLCGEQVDINLPGSDPMGPTIDHLVTLTSGGIDCLTNVALAHWSCNVARGAKPLEAAWASLT